MIVNTRKYTCNYCGAEISWFTRWDGVAVPMGCNCLPSDRVNKDGQPNPAKTQAKASRGRREGAAREKKLQEAFSLTPDRIDKELDDLEAFLKGRTVPQLDMRVDLELLSELRESYADWLGEGFRDKSLSGIVVNLELFLLKKLLTEAPGYVLELLLRRLEDLYVTVGEASFESQPGCLNEKLESMWCVIERKPVNIRWNRFPIMRTFLVPIERLRHEDVAGFPTLRSSVGTVLNDVDQHHTPGPETPQFTGRSKRLEVWDQTSMGVTLIYDTHAQAGIPSYFRPRLSLMMTGERVAVLFAHFGDLPMPQISQDKIDAHLQAMFPVLESRFWVWGEYRWITYLGNQHLVARNHTDASEIIRKYLQNRPEVPNVLPKVPTTTRANRDSNRGPYVILTTPIGRHGMVSALFPGKAASFTEAGRLLVEAPNVQIFRGSSLDIMLNLKL